jgi:chorismate dehydratase
MSRARLGAVEYLNARPLVYGLEQSPRFALRFDVPSRCASLLHEGAIDVGLIPSIEYLRGPVETARVSPKLASNTARAEADGPYVQQTAGYAIVPGMAISSRGPVASVAIYATKAISDVASLALDTSSRSSVALARVLCARAFRISPAFSSHPPDLQAMLKVADAALIIGDHALFTDGGAFEIDGRRTDVEKIDLGDVWTTSTGLPFVYAFWAGRPDALRPGDIEILRSAKAEGVARVEAIAASYFSGEPARQLAGASYLRDNIKYDFGADERAGLELFYRYAAECGVVNEVRPLRFY